MKSGQRCATRPCWQPAFPAHALTQMADGHLEGEIQVAFGPIAALFTGAGSLSLDPAARRATLSGEGRDRRSGTRLSATATFILDAATRTTTRIVLEVKYALRGPLAHLARGPVVSALTASIAETVARNLERRLAGETQAAVPAKFLVGDLLLRVVWQRLHGGCVSNERGQSNALLPVVEICHCGRGR